MNNTNFAIETERLNYTWVGPDDLVHQVWPESGSQYGTGAKLSERVVAHCSIQSGVPVWSKEFLHDIVYVSSLKLPRTVTCLACIAAPDF